METNLSHLTPVNVNGFILFSIFDDTDRMYHADAETGKTPAQERIAQSADEQTKA